MVMATLENLESWNRDYEICNFDFKKSNKSAWPDIEKVQDSNDRKYVHCHYSFYMYSVFINKLRMGSIHILPKQPPNPQGPNRNSSPEHLNEKIK